MTSAKALVACRAPRRQTRRRRLSADRRALGRALAPPCTSGGTLRPFWPMRASSSNIRRMRLPGCASATASGVHRAPSMPLAGGLVLVGVVLVSAFCSREAHGRRTTRLMEARCIRLAEALRTDESQVLQSVGRDAVDLRIVTGQDHLGQLGLSSASSRGGRPSLRAIREPCDARPGVVANDPVAQRLPVHASRSCWPPPGSCPSRHWRSRSRRRATRTSRPVLARDRSLPWRTMLPMTSAGMVPIECSPEVT